jgi:putative oxidoreductase
MDTIKKLNKWANAHTSYPLDILRVALGIFLFTKGISFITNSEYLLEIIKPLQNYGGGMMMIHYVAPAHLIGGILITFGLLTRWALWAQLPILIGAVIINFIGEMVIQNLLISTLTLLISIFFLFFGSGKHSADYYFKMQK